MTTQANALSLAKLALNTAEMIRDDVRDMTETGDALFIRLHIESAERNLRNLKDMLSSPDFHVTHDDDPADMIAEGERAIDQILDYRELTGL